MGAYTSIALQGLVPLLLRRACIPGWRMIVQPVGQLDDDDPDVLGHGHQHFPQVLRLLLLPGGVGDLAQLGDAVHQQGHLLAELLA